MVGIATIGSGAGFLDALAAGLLAEVAATPESLADALVLLPTRRACQRLAEAFLRQTGGRPLLLPRLQPLGEIEADELLVEGSIAAGLPPAIGSLRRQLLLARLLAPLGRTGEHAWRLAGELALLLDDLQTERVDLAGMARIVPEQLAEHWQLTREVLLILAEHWPGVLAGEGAIDPAERRHRLLVALAERWRSRPPTRRIVAAGSTGSILATRTLLATIARLPTGTVVLPGLDRELDEPSWQALKPSHPQHGLRQLLEAANVDRQAVTLWPAAARDVPAESASPAGPASLAGAVTTAGPLPRVGPLPRAVPARRAAFLREVMRPSETIGAWQHLAPPAAGDLEGLTLETHPDPASEALAIALRLRAALEGPARTAALITRDRQLARRVAAELHRFAIEIDDSAGTPLDQTPPGAFLLLTARLIVDGVTPVRLLATLQHPFARGGQSRAVLIEQARELDRRHLRGPRIADGFPGILKELHRSRRRALAKERAVEATDRSIALIGRLEADARPFAELARGEVEVGTLVRAHLAFAEALAAGPDGTSELWSREAGETAAELLAELHEATADGHRMAAAAYPAWLAELMAARPVRPRAPRHPRLFVWGPLEARLQRVDLALIGGLNEGVWPGPVDAGPWLNRAMRAELGLAPIEQRLGLAAHDLVEAASAPEVVLSRAEKDAQGKPTVPSRWWVRLTTLLDSLGCGSAVEDQRYADWSRQLDAPSGAPRPVQRPAPTPPLAARPRALSVSDVGLWMRDPYDLYAKRILGLRPLEPLDADPGPLEKGNVIHQALEWFVAAHPRGALPEDAEQRLLDLGQKAFEPYRHRPQVRALWWPRFARIARWVVEEERRRRDKGIALHAEVAGALAIPATGGGFRLIARADRLEQRADGGVTVIDYKSGQLPAPAEVQSGRQPQLPLEAAMVRAGAFDGFAPAAIDQILFWRLVGDLVGGEAKSAGKAPPAELAELAIAGLSRVIDHYDDPTTAYPARAKPAVAWRGDYDHLARRGEWANP